MSLNGIDISDAQTGINLKQVEAGFVIVKTTQDVGFTSPPWLQQAYGTLNSGKILGLYHYVGGNGGAQAEAQHFANTIKPFNGRAFIAIDWEPDQNSAWGNTQYLTTLVQTVTQLTGLHGLIYGPESALSTLSAAKAATGWQLWVAQYADSNPTGYQAIPWNSGAYACAMRQYSSHGRLNGWSGDLDLDLWYGDEATLTALTHPTTTTPTPANTLKEFLGIMIYTHILFTHTTGKNTTIGIYNVLSGTYHFYSNPQQLKDALHVLTLAGAKIINWGKLHGSPNDNIDDLPALGARI